MAGARVLGNEARTKDMMLKETLGVRLDAAESPLGFFPRGKQTAEVECESRGRPEHCSHMNQHQGRPAQNEETSKHHECDVSAVGQHNESSERPVNHWLFRSGAIHNFPSGNCPA